jgi:uncharacterized delta-60 repeat protein
MSLLLQTTIIVLCVTAYCFSQSPGTLDLTFGNGGKVIAGTNRGTDSALAMAVQSDGKIVAAGESQRNGSGFDFALVRYAPDGTLDTSFGDGGKVTTAIGSAYAYAFAISLQPDGKIVAAGTSSNGSNEDLAIVRYNSDGSLDSTFGTGGKVTTAIGPGTDRASAVAMQSDGKIVVSVRSSIGDFVLVRYNPNGSLDGAFGSGGIVTTDVSSSEDNANAVTIQPDGKIVAAGYGYSDFALARYNSNGSLDSMFGVGGLVATPIGSAFANASDVMLQSDGMIVVAGTAFNGSNYDFAVARYNTNGSLDTAFGSGGTVMTPIGLNHDEAYTVTLQSDGKIVAAGDINQGHGAALVRYNSNGSLDETFGSGGKVTTLSLGSPYRVHDVALQSNGKIVAAGPNDYDFALVRYEPDGLLDATFNDRGIVTTDFGVFISNPPLETVAIQPDGKIVAAARPSLYTGPTVTRFNQDGSLDTTFGGGTGYVYVYCNEYAHHVDIALQQDGKIVGACYDSSVGSGNLLFRLDTAGSLDPSFGSNGYVSSQRMPWAVAIQLDGKIIYSGDGICRLNADGSPDTSFGSAGCADIPPHTNFFESGIQSDGKIVAAGYSFFNSGNYDFAIVRFTSTGALDTTFNGDGIVITDLGGGDIADSLSLQTDGKIVAAGESHTGGAPTIALVRYNSNGSLDTTFDDDGIVVRPLGGGVNSLAVQDDGRIVASTTVDAGADRHDDFAIVRLNSDGSPDTTFGGPLGVVYVDFNESHDVSLAMVLDNHGRAVVVGGSNGAFALARVLLNSKVRFDFDGDGRSDVSVFRPSDSVWYLNRSTQGFSATQFGLATDKIAPADYDGDGKTDIAIFRDGVWWRINSGDLTVNATAFGLAGDNPVPADYTGDGRDELAVYRNGQWWMFDLSTHQASLVNFGLASDKPVPADYDGDGRVDQAVYRNGEWHIYRSTLGYAVILFGLATDRPVVGDYDGDGRADLAVYRDGTWYLQQSTDGFRALRWGLATDIPTPADYDGDGKTDAAVFRNGTWYLRQTTGVVSIQQFGLAGDKPVESAFIAQ